MPFLYLGNAVANVIRSLWSSAVIFNGHFTEDAETFEEDNTETETRANGIYVRFVVQVTLVVHKVYIS
jgi:fatty acid desaturase